MSKNQKPVWKPVSETKSNRYSSFTLVRVKGWGRFGFASWDSIGERWTLDITDPSIGNDATEALNITHWLALLD